MSAASEAPPPPGLVRNARPNPNDAWFPSRSRKLLPRLVTVAPADRSESILVRDGVGVGIGVGVGVGVAWAWCGDGAGAIDAARAGGDVAATASIRPKTMAMAPLRLRPVPLSFARAGRGEQHMDAISKERQFETNYQNYASPR